MVYNLCDYTCGCDVGENRTPLKRNNNRDCGLTHYSAALLLCYFFSCILLKNTIKVLINTSLLIKFFYFVKNLINTFYTFY